MITRELTLKELLYTAKIMLTEEEHTSWVYYENDWYWWVVRLFTRIN